MFETRFTKKSFQVHYIRNNVKVLFTRRNSRFRQEIFVRTSEPEHAFSFVEEAFGNHHAQISSQLITVSQSRIKQNRFWYLLMLQKIRWQSN